LNCKAPLTYKSSRRRFMPPLKPGVSQHLADEVLRGDSVGEKYLDETHLLEYGHPSIAQLIEDKKWKHLGEHDRIGAVYDFVQNEIAFGYNESDDIPASKVLREGGSIQPC
jgi:hypothetical protein